MQKDPDAYLEPYQRALRQHGTAFASLLWASPTTQAARFAALVRAYDFTGKRVLDAGCGQADLLDYLLARGMGPEEYIGLEAMDEHIRVARRKGQARRQIIKGDFVKEPARLLCGTEAIVFCGSLNTMSREVFERTIETALKAASEAVVFNFLCSPRLASADWLTWHERDEVMELGRRLGGQVRVVDDYMEGDCTVAIGRKKRRSD